MLGLTLCWDFGRRARGSTVVGKDIMDLRATFVAPYYYYLFSVVVPVAIDLAVIFCSLYFFLRNGSDNDHDSNNNYDNNSNINGGSNGSGSCGLVVTYYSCAYSHC